MSDHKTEKEFPLMLIGLGIVLYVVAAFVHVGPRGVGPTLVLVLIGGAVQTLILLAAAFLVATVLRTSFGDARAAVLKFAGASLTSGGIAVLIPLGGIIGLVVFLGLVMWLFEVELTYAVALTVVNWVISICVGIAIASAAR